MTYSCKSKCLNPKRSIRSHDVLPNPLHVPLGLYSHLTFRNDLSCYVNIRKHPAVPWPISRLLQLTAGLCPHICFSPLVRYRRWSGIGPVHGHEINEVDINILARPFTVHYLDDNFATTRTARLRCDGRRRFPARRFCRDRAVPFNQINTRLLSPRRCLLLFASGCFSVHMERLDIEDDEQRLRRIRMAKMFF